MKKSSNKYFAIIIVLLFIIAFPIIKATYNTVASSIENQIENNKRAYCKREFPDYLQRAISKDELKHWVDDYLVKHPDEPIYQFLDTRKGLSWREWVVKKFSWKLEDKYFYASNFYSDSNKCERDGVYLTDELPWYSI